MQTEITLDKEYTLEIKPAVPALVIKFSSIRVEVHDNLMSEVQADVFIEGLEDPLTMSLFNDVTPKTYAQIGSWTNKDVIDRILEILKLT